MALGFCNLIIIVDSMKHLIKYYQLIKTVNLQSNCLVSSAHESTAVNKPVSQSSAAATVTGENFWQATGQSNLAYKQLAATKASKVCLLLYSHNCTLANGAVFHSVCQVWLSSGPPEIVTFSYCTWLWNWLIKQQKFSTSVCTIIRIVPP